MERTVVLIKPDGVKRGLIGEILSRFEKAGLKIVGMKMVWVDFDLAEKHYPKDKDYLTALGKKSLETYQKYGKDPKEKLGTKDPARIGKMVRSWFANYLTSGPVVAVLLEGNHAIDQVRTMIGHTLPNLAAPGTIRGDYSTDSPVLANAAKRAVKNLVHASGTPQEAKFEEQLWFKKDEIHSYKRAEEEVMF